MRRRGISAALMGAVALCVALPAAAPAKKPSSLPPAEGSAPRPGPAILYAPPATAPQLENATGSPWKAKPILVSGAGAYRKGEFLYQGYLYDDHGAKELVDPTNPMISPGGDPTGGDVFSEPDGTYTYPTGPGYDENAADLVELRVKPLRMATAFRITLNTLENPSLVATAIAIGGARRRNASVPVRRQRARAGAVLPDRSRRNRRPDRCGHRRTGSGPRAVGRGGPRAQADRSPGPACRLGTRGGHGAARGGRRALERNERVLPAAGGRRLRDAARRGRRRHRAAGVLRRRLPLQPPGAAARHAGADDRDEPRVVARIGAGAGAGERRHQRVPRRGRLRQAEGEGRRRNAGPARRRAAERAPSTASSPRTSPKVRARTTPRAAAAPPPRAPASCAAGSSRMRSTCRPAPSRPPGGG